MKSITRRELLQQSAVLAAAARLGIGKAQAAPDGTSIYDWIRSPRIPPKNTLVLHLLANTGNKNQHLRPREGFLPVTDVKARIKVSSQPKSVSLLQSGEKIHAAYDDGWIELTVPRVLIHDSVRVDLV